MIRNASQFSYRFTFTSHPPVSPSNARLLMPSMGPHQNEQSQEEGPKEKPTKLSYRILQGPPSRYSLPSLPCSKRRPMSEFSLPTNQPRNLCANAQKISCVSLSHPYVRPSIPPFRAMRLSVVEILFCNYNKRLPAPTDVSPRQSRQSRGKCSARVLERKK